MIDHIFSFCLRNRILVILAALVLIIIGIWSVLRLPIDATPDITNVQVQINTAVPALAPEEIEKLVSYPIEMEMGGIEDLTEVRSLSKFGLSQITLVFKDGSDIYRARQLVNERLQTITDELPPGIVPKLAPITTGLGEIYHYIVRYRENAPGIPPDSVEQLRQLKLVQDYVIKPALRGVPGVTEVNTSGGYEKEIVIQPNPAKLSAAGMSFLDIAELVSENTQNAGGSIIEKGGETVTIRVNGRVRSIEDIAAIPLKFTSGTQTLTLGEVADIVIGSGARTGSATYNGEEAVLGSALMLMGENARIVSKRIHEKITELSAQLPEGIVIETVYDRTDVIDATIATVRSNLLGGAILVIAVLFLLLGNFRAAIIVAMAIPLSMLFAFFGMERFGVSGNLMSLGAIDFGLIVDGAVVMVENIVRTLSQRQKELGRLPDPKERCAIILGACKQVGTPVVFGVFIITVVYFPIFSLGGIEGKMFKPMALAVVFALVGALVLSVTLVPVLCSLMLTKKIREEDNIAVRFCKRIYSPVLHLGYRFRWLVTMAAIAIFAFSIWTFRHLGAEFIPQLDEGSLAAQMIRTTSIGLNTSMEMQKASERILLEKFPELSHTFSRVGTSEVATDPMGVNIGDTYLMMHPRSQWRQVNGRPISKAGLVNLMSEELAVHFPGQSNLFSQPIELRFNELLSGSRADIAVKIFGDDYEMIESLAQEILEIIEVIPGASDVEFDASGKAPVLQISPDRKALQRHNVHASEINALIETAYAGAEAGTLTEGDRRFPIIVRLDEKIRKNFQAVSGLPVRSHDGNLLPLSRVADIHVVEDINSISRENFQRRMAIQVNLRGRDVQSFVDEVHKRIEDSIKLPDGYHIAYGGAFKNLQDARERLAIVIPVVIAFILILTLMALRSVRQTFIICTSIPLAVTGGIFALWLRDMPFSISAAVGFIALSGIAVLNGLMMITLMNQLREQGLSLSEAVTKGAIARLRPVLMTALVASLGFIPMAIASGPGAEVQRPLATVVIGGIITSTLLTLVLLPSLYRWWEGKSQGPSAP